MGIFRPPSIKSVAELWDSTLALPLARLTGSAERIREGGGEGLLRLLTEHQLSSRRARIAKILAWAEQAPSAPPHPALRVQILGTLDDDRLRKNQEITVLEQRCAAFLVRTPYVLLLVVPGINVLSAAEVAGEVGPITFYPHANALTGRAGLMPSRYQSDRVDRPDGPLRRRGNRRLRTALMQVADNLIACNHYFAAKAGQWRTQGKDARWQRVKVAKIFSRLLFAMVAGRQLFPHPCRQERHYILNKLLEFHRICDTPLSQVLGDLDAATQQLPRSAHAAEAKPSPNASRRCNTAEDHNPWPT